MRVGIRSRVQITGVLLSIAGCGDSDGGGRTNVLRPDSGSGMDARVDSDAEVVDAGLDAASGDGAAGPADDDDAGGPSEPFDPSEDCQVVAERSELALPVTFGDESGFAITPGLTGFGVAYQSNNCGAIGVLPVASVGQYAEPHTLYNQCDTVAQGVSLLHVNNGYRLSWVDNSSGSAELQSLQLTEALKAAADSTRKVLTNNQTRELAPIQANLVGSDYLAWIDQDDAKRVIMLQGIAGSEAKVLVDADAEYAPTRLALAQLGGDSGALAFVSEQKKPGVWLVPLTATGEVRGAPVQLSAAVTTGNSVDLATRDEDGGAVVYTVDIGGRHEVRFRRLNKQGGFLSDEVKIATFPLQGRDASIARLGGGYVVAFRSPSATDPARGEVRLIFVTKEGNLQRDSAGVVTSYLVAEASSTGGRVTARVSQDGQLLVGFLDIGTGAENGPKLRLIRKRLDCAL